MEEHANDDQPRGQDGLAKHHFPLERKRKDAVKERKVDPPLIWPDTVGAVTCLPRIGIVCLIDPIVRCGKNDLGDRWRFERGVQLERLVIPFLPLWRRGDIGRRNRCHHATIRTADGLARPVGRGRKPCLTQRTLKRNRSRLDRAQFRGRRLRLNRPNLVLLTREARRAVSSRALEVGSESRLRTAVGTRRPTTNGPHPSDQPRLANAAFEAEEPRTAVTIGKGRPLRLRVGPDPPSPRPRGDEPLSIPLSPRLRGTNHFTPPSSGEGLGVGVFAS